MKKLTLLEASKKVGRSKQAIVKAVKKGTISATKNDKGIYVIDPSELFRVYEPIDNNNEQPSNTNVDNYIENDTSNQNINITKKDIEKEVLLAQLKEQLKAVEKELHSKSVLLDKTERQLREEISEKKELQAKFNNLLTDQSKKTKKGLLGRLFG